MTADDASDIYDILVLHAGAIPAKKHHFMKFMVAGEPNYQFGGLLGATATFYANRPEWYIKADPTKTASEFVQVVEHTNYELMLLQNSREPVGAIAISLYEHYRNLHRSLFTQIAAHSGLQAGLPARSLSITFKRVKQGEPCLQIACSDKITVQTKIKEDRTHVNWRFKWSAIGIVAYEDPAMMDKLDFIVKKGLLSSRITQLEMLQLAQEERKG